MNADQGLFVPLILGIIEGVTEFLPVSSTGHILLVGHFLGFDSPGRVFEVMIQLGAILAIVVIYFQRLLGIAKDAIARKPGALRFILGVFLASFPAALAGVLAHDFIKTVIYETPIVICVMLIVPSFTSLRFSGHAIDGSAMASPAAEICAYQSKRIGALATRVAISSER